MVMPISSGGDHVAETESTESLLPKNQQRGGGEDDGGGGDDFHGASFAGAVFNLSTTIVGAGIMALPATMKVLGLAPGLVLVVLAALLTDASIELLVRFTRAAGVKTYGKAMGDAFGPLGRGFLQFCVVVNNLGVMVVYMIIIGDVLSGTSSSGVHHHGVIEGWFGPNRWNGRFAILTITTLGVFAPLTCFKRVGNSFEKDRVKKILAIVKSVAIIFFLNSFQSVIHALISDSLRFTSAVSVALAVVFVVITAGIAIFKLARGQIPMPQLFADVHDWTSIWRLFTAAPVLVTAYICHYNGNIKNSELINRHN
jgi:sodium-coupled neutral amino acid transporter 2